MTITRLVHLVSAAGLIILSLGSAQAQSAADHLKCHRISDVVTANTIVTADVLPLDVPPFVAQSCRIKLRGGQFCTGVQKTDVRDRNGEPFAVLPIGGGPAGDYFCYRLRCPRAYPRMGTPLAVRDQLGTRTVHVKRPDFLCAPAETTLGMAD